MKNWSHVFGVRQRAPRDHGTQHLYSGGSEAGEIDLTLLWESGLLQLPIKIPMRIAKAELLATKTGNPWRESGRNVPQL